MRITASPARCWAFSAWILLSFAAAGTAQRPLLEPLRTMLPPDASGAAAVALGDVDGDRDIDAVIGNGDLLRGQNLLYLNDGFGAFTDVTATRFPVDSNYTTAVALGDVDGDGDADAVFGNRNRNKLYVNNGAGYFTDATASRMPPNSDNTNALALGDVDGDGDLDMVAGNVDDYYRNGEQNKLYLNDGSGNFTDVTATHLPIDLDFTLAVVLGDVDGDGDLDMVFGNSDDPCAGYQESCAPGQRNRLYLNNGGGVFTDVTAARFPNDADFTNTVALADVDGDQDLDVLLGNDAQNRLYLNDGGGFYTDVTLARLPADSDFTFAVALVDVDGDRDLDALLGNGGRTQNRLYHNNGSGVFTDATADNLSPDTDSTNALASGDVDGDHAVDILAGNGGQNRLYLNDGRGAFDSRASASLPPDSEASDAVALGDVDADGDLDALIGNSGSRKRLYLNNGNGVFTEAAAARVPLDTNQTNALVLGDVDGDQDLDALIGNAYSSQNRLYLNDGSGAFTDATNEKLPTIRDSTWALAMGDVDGDQDLDAVIGNWASRNLLYLNDGNGVFTDVSAASFPQYIDATFAVELGDVDGDGDLDVVIANTFGEQNTLYLNDGNGVFADVTAKQFPPDTDYTWDVALGDVDGDGDLDAVTGNAGSQNRLYLNDGNGVFTDATAGRLPPDSDTPYAVDLADLDDDGDLDVFIGNGGGQNLLFLNDGNGVFTDVSAESIAPIRGLTTAVALGDVDGDLDVDAVIGNNSGQNRLYTNLTRQLAWRALPRIGRPLTMDLYGPPASAWALFLSPATARFPLPFGTFRLDPTLLVVAGLGSFDAHGSASVGFAVPSIPSWSGVTLYWQALIASPLALTNLERTTLTGQ